MEPKQPAPFSHFAQDPVFRSLGNLSTAQGLLDFLKVGDASHEQQRRAVQAFTDQNPKVLTIASLATSLKDADLL